MPAACAAASARDLERVAEQLAQRHVCLREASLRVDLVEAAPGHVLHRQESDVVAAARLEDGHDVLVTQLRHGARLALEARQRLCGRRELGPHDLERHAPREALVLGEVDDAHAAGAEPFDQPVRAEALERQRGGRDRARGAPAEHAGELDEPRGLIGRELGVPREERLDVPARAAQELVHELIDGALERREVVHGWPGV
jgi:hypothetical protein